MGKLKLEDLSSDILFYSFYPICDAKTQKYIKIEIGFNLFTPQK